MKIEDVKVGMEVWWRPHGGQVRRGRVDGWVKPLKGGGARGRRSKVRVYATDVPVKAFLSVPLLKELPVKALRRCPPVEQPAPARVAKTKALAVALEAEIRRVVAELRGAPAGVVEASSDGRRLTVHLGPQEATALLARVATR